MINAEGPEGLTASNKGLLPGAIYKSSPRSAHRALAGKLGFAELLAQANRSNDLRTHAMQRRAYKRPLKGGFAW